MDKRHRNIAAVLSVLAQGLGQFYNRQWTKGALFLLMHIGALLYLVPRIGETFWGLITLGETPQQQVIGANKATQVIAGDHSIFLMINGLINIVVIILFLALYVLSVYDAYQTGKERDHGRPVQSFSYTIQNLRGKYFPYLMLVIPIIGVLFFTIMPIIFSVLLAFTNYSAPNNIPPKNLVDWTGFQSFIDLLQLKTWSKTFYGVFSWTITWAILATVTCYFGGIVVALLIEAKCVKYKKLWRTLYIIPYAIPQLISLLVMKNLFNAKFGPINQYLKYFGIGELPWLTDPLWAKVTLVLVNMWIGIPVTMLLVTGLLTTIPRDLYEAAEVDGAGIWSKFKMITMPFILFSTAPILIMQFAGNINNFNVIYLLTGGGPAKGEYQFAGSTDLLVTWLFNLTFTSNKFNMSAAIGIIIFVLIATISIYSFRRSKSFREEDMLS